MRLEDAGYPIVLHVHDEIVAECPDGFGSSEELLKLITTLPDWAEGLPIAAKVREGQRFCKIKAPEKPEPPEPPDAPPPDAPDEPERTEPPAGEPREQDMAQEQPRTNGYGAHNNDFHDYPSGEEERGQRVACYIYKDERGEEYQKVTRMISPGGKTFPQAFRVDGRWVNKKPAGWVNILYRLPELITAKADETTWIPEGEKDVNSLVALGLIATTNPGGAGKWTADLNKWFVGRKRINITEDNDPDGRAHAIKVAMAMHGIGIPDIRIISFPELPERGDVSDWLAQGHTKEELIARAEAATKWEPVKLQWIDMSNWDSEPVPEQEWAVPDRIPLRQCVLFSGEGSAGKSTTQLHLSVAHVFARDWLGTVPEVGPAIYIDAEDDESVLHRRLAAILDHYNVTFSEAVKGGLHLMSLAGQDAVLASASRNGRIEPTALYKQLLEAAGDIRPKMIGIASSANVYAGSEIDRSQVQQFISLLTRIAIVANGSLALISHPSLTGINTDTGLSGNTQWHNAVRARFYMKSVKPEAGEQPDSDLREIVFKKNNYGPISASIVLRYQNGLFLPVPGMASLDQATREARADEIFLELLHRFATENRYVSDKRSSAYAPAVFAKEDVARKAGINSTDLAGAMRRLFTAGKIWNEPCGRPSRPTYRIAVKL